MGSNSGSWDFQASGNSYGARRRRRKNRQTVLLAILAVLIIILIIALVFIISDMIKNRKTGDERGPSGSGAATSAARLEDPAEHPASLACDGSDITYMLSPADQSVGSYFLLDLGSETEISKISVLSYHSDYYIRSAVVQISSDSETWTAAGDFTGRPSDSASTVFDVGGAKASYIRLVLTSSADLPWALNTFAAEGPGGARITPRGHIAGAIPSGSEQNTGVQTSPGPGGYTSVVKSRSDIHTGTLILVGLNNEYIFPESSASILEMYDNRTPFKDASGNTVYSYQIGDVKLCLLDAVALVHLNDMCDDFYRETGINRLHVGTNSGYRSRQTQAELAGKYQNAAPAGFSDHNTGLSVNLNIFENGSSYEFDSAANPNCGIALSWLTKNAYKYGFIDRYPADKDEKTGMKIDRFHYRYVGFPHAYYMVKNNLCLEEYLSLLANDYPFDRTHLNFAADNGKNYEIYYVKAAPADSTTVIKVPADSSYSVSGDNFSGFIVTIEK
ncbi:MAG: D-alanyl-D-alanine carboxypeptidase family protein [Clostridia bacterium]|nr:D-alanyl-D-alanine carboxypeptidase family protein [Clostridia bacterium]